MLAFEVDDVCAGAASEEDATVVGTTHSPVMVIVVASEAVIVVGAHLWSLQVVIVTMVDAGQYVV